jgi:hypothetical protein
MEKGTRLLEREPPSLDLLLALLLALLVLVLVEKQATLFAVFVVGVVVGITLCWRCCCGNSDDDDVKQRDGCWSVLTTLLDCPAKAAKDRLVLPAA